MIEKEIGFMAGDSSGKVSAVLLRPEKARWLMVFAHGAGAGIRHEFMAAMALHLAERGIASFRYQFPYMEQGKKSPDPQPILLETVRSAVAAAQEYGSEFAPAGRRQIPGRSYDLDCRFPGSPAGGKRSCLFRISPSRPGKTFKRTGRTFVQNPPAHAFPARNAGHAGRPGLNAFFVRSIAKERDG